MKTGNAILIVGGVLLLIIVLILGALITEPVTITGQIGELKIDTFQADVYIKDLHYEFDGRLIWLLLLGQ